MQFRNWAILVSVLFALSAFAGAQDDKILFSGSDLWQTPADGRTFINFFVDPIPADFFCEGSQPFEGRIEFKGVPLATYPPKVLGDTDTVLERLDDAEFDEDGVARTRLVFRALSLISIEPVKTECGLFVVRASLDGGEQPESMMTILRDRRDGGRYLAEIRGNAQLTFIPADEAELAGGASFRVGEKVQELRISRTIDFPVDQRHVWSTRPMGKTSFRNSQFAMVDSDADGTPDTWTPAPSNFAAGVLSGALLRVAQTVLASQCHCNSINLTHTCFQHGHCQVPVRIFPDLPHEEQP